MGKDESVDDAVKDVLIEQFRAYLDTAEAGTEPEPSSAPGADLVALLVELAGLRTEVRTESRLVKDALDQFRSVFDRLQAGNALLERELERARAEQQEKTRVLLRPLLVELLDLRDRISAAAREGVASAPAVPWYRRWRRQPAAPPEGWREGQAMTLRRLDRILADRQVVALTAVGRPFDPRTMRAVATVEDQGRDHGVVVEEMRPGFLWGDDLLRPAEVVVNRLVVEKGAGT